MTTTDGPFGLGSQMNYGWHGWTRCKSGRRSGDRLISPAGNQVVFRRQADGTLRNSTIPWLQSTVMATSNGQATVRAADGTTSVFQPFAGISTLVSNTDRNGNTVTFTETPLNATAIRITQITDPVGQSFTLTYDGNAHVTSISDPIPAARCLTPTTPAARWPTVTDAAGGVTSYTYDSQNHIVSMADPLE